MPEKKADNETYAAYAAAILGEMATQYEMDLATLIALKDHIEFLIPND